ncbi:glycosyltransferase family protein [Kibdelosporangium aridum]|uniref:Dolichyl-phosphate-mannose-protein mannosyltransferase n=1 Tax=Kibdelosporangium aridum TaxID=2030 RepID=A0A1W2D4A7_KIBAR|nr:glycosyltransferase family 39 protein [Kibdelosporangium aridum]SMC92367.1 Dolichyl-phosphate-mannose-protein mannosyltransferase [Kibdelosporangium aridum]
MTELALRRSTVMFDWLSERSKQIAVAAIGLSLMLAGGYGVILGNDLRYSDEHVYLELTQSLVDGRGFAFGTDSTAYRPPGYPFLLLPLHLVSGGNVFVMRLLGIACLAGAVWFGYLLARRISPVAGALVAVVTAAYPLFVYTATALYPQMPALFLLLMMLEFGLRARDRWVWAIPSGLSAGFLTITVPSFAPTLLLLAIFIGWRKRKAIAVLLVAAAIIPGLWCIRNAVVMGAFIPVSTNNGVNLLLGNNPSATGSSGTSVDVMAYEQRAKELNLDEVGIDKFYSDQAVEWITSNPAQAAGLYVAKVAHNFAYSDTLKTEGQGASDLLAALSYYPILALAVLRIMLSKRFPLRRVDKLCLWAIALNVLLLAVFFTRIRFRVPLDELTIILAVSTVVVWWDRRRIA